MNRINELRNFVEHNTSEMSVNVYNGIYSIMQSIEYNETITNRAKELVKNDKEVAKYNQYPEKWIKNTLKNFTEDNKAEMSVNVYNGLWDLIQCIELTE